MPSQATSSLLAVTVLLALWLGSGRCGTADTPGLGCDNGKLSLDRDLPADVVYWDCGVPTRPESTEIPPSIGTVYDPEPARQMCMDEPIAYSRTIPNSGAFRPVRAETGEYLYCPPQRWLNNLHNGDAVLLHHPCAPLHERRLLSGLARSCLTGYIITPHPQLNRHKPIALVSWGRTLELATAASLDVCDWLQTTQTTRSETDDATQTMKYNLLLTRSAEPRQLEGNETKGSLWRCCEQAVSSLLGSASVAPPSMKEEHLIRSKSREMRAAIGEVQEKNSERLNTTSQTHRTVTQKDSSMLGSSANSLVGKRNLSDPSFQRPTLQSKIPKQDQGFTHRPTTHSASVIFKTAVRTDSVGSRTSQAEKGGPVPETDLRGMDSSAGTDVLPDGGTSEQSHRDADSAKRSMKENKSDEERAADGETKDNQVVDVKEREAERKQKHIAAHSRHNSGNSGFHSASKTQSESQPREKPQPAILSEDCGGCQGERCDCAKTPGAETGAAVASKGLPRTPRTDEAMWAAAALGFLLVLLTLSVLHTRLYRRWRTVPSLYWHDPQRDYDSVADVIHRRLRIAKRRRKRSRRQECVLLPSSSSSDEYP
ncbi:uncharacterized protein tp53i13 isoform 2-T2 [Odontesthes bonariensis]|uniref:uncharacterized protein tp53i13 isoform X2 n=1 Tax=Odontesthes bonariensis TaxID=219752 RepID=UPI003F589983